MLSLTYEEQLTNAFYHYNEFLNLAIRGNFTAVKPFVSHSRLYGVQTLQPGSHDIELLMDMKTLEKDFLQCIGDNRTTLIEPMDSFLQNSFRKIVVVYFSHHALPFHKWIGVPESLYLSLKKVFTDDTKPIVTCTKEVKDSLVPAVEKVLQKEQAKLKQSISKEHLFKVQEVLCIHSRAPLTLVQLMDHIVQYLKTTGDEASVLFTSWQGKFTRKFPDLKTITHCVQLFQYSDKVKNLAAQFQQTRGLQPNKFISLHIRFEKVYEFGFLRRHPNETAYYQCCMTRVKLLLEALSDKLNIPLNQTLFLKDYSSLNLGTDSCHFQGHWQKGQVCIAEMKKLLPLLPVSVSEFDPKAYEGASWENNSGFVALVEQASLLEGRVLVTVGGGAFQGQLIHRYNKHHSSNAETAANLHYHVCNNEVLNGLKINHQNC